MYFPIQPIMPHMTYLAPNLDDSYGITPIFEGIEKKENLRC